MNNKQVQKDVRKNFYAADHFLDKVLDSYLILLGVESLDADVDCGKELDDMKGMSIGRHILLALLYNNFDLRQIYCCIALSHEYVTVKWGFYWSGLGIAYVVGVIIHWHVLW